ncbi:bifunctional DNA primase/polymerase [Streptomyces sp. PLK6-54]|uniref:Bifunctional DNA primase/polymerase n=1 Tax=Actinacidiphila acidipaludis TaxID=2873382 RepID=A0ABS7Q0N4_9ACTN|nr:bifunctional DNA primase/polymerase [Streptomyces acidipaludis]MBY8876696.1 bifunctional DNA primase/polymerase [Streptomyces acidipaludis]
MEDTIGVPGQLTGQLLDTAVRYAEERNWDVLPGAWLETTPAGAPRCSCSSAACPAPGAHPTRPDWATQASGNAVAVRGMWQRQPHASVLLPTGRTFDAIDVPESAGFLALARMERMELPLGPVVSTPTRRMVFFVLPGATPKVPDVLRRLGRQPELLDLVVRGQGDWIAAPPTRMGTGGRVQWARRPTAMNRWLPDAEELLSPLAYACGRDAAGAKVSGARDAVRAAGAPGPAAAAGVWNVAGTRATARA